MQDSNSNYLQTRLNINWEKNQSQTIDLLRFPLVVCVVFIHQFPNVTNILDADFQLLSGRGVYNLICIIFSVILPTGVLCQCLVLVPLSLRDGPEVIPTGRRSCVFNLAYKIIGEYIPY